TNRFSLRFVCRSPKKLMRTLHICSGNLYGGVETIQVTLARYRHECPQMEPHFTVCFEGRLSRELRELEVPVHTVGAVRVVRPAHDSRLRQAIASSGLEAARRQFDRCRLGQPLSNIYQSIASGLGGANAA